MNTFIGGLVAYVLTSPQFQSLQRSAVKGIGVWLIAHGLDQAHADTAITALTTGAIALISGLISSARATAVGTANVTPIAQNPQPTA